MRRDRGERPRRGQESSPERPVLTVAQVFDLAEAISGRYRALVLLGSFGSLRWAELTAPRRSDIDLAVCTVRIERTLIELQNGQLSFGPTKSAAGRRTIVFPELIAPELARPSSYRQRADRQRSQPPRADDPDGAHQHACGTDLPALDGRTPAGDSCRPGTARASTHDSRQSQP
jgi:integrase